MGQRDSTTGTLPRESGFAQPARQDSFIKNVSRALRHYRLGDLLIDAGLITSDQLTIALREQRTTKEQLGKILVRQGAVSAVQLYRKLAQQWCIKASTAGLTLFMQTMSPTMAHAEDSSVNNVRLASAFSPAAIRPATVGIQHPNLFGTAEIRSNDISAFTKWTTTMARFDNQMASSQGQSPRVMMWKAKLQELKGRSVQEQLAGVNDFANGVRYIEDIDNYGKSDYWATPVEFFTRGGDCEDFAIAKYASLRAIGYTTDQLRIAIVQDKIKNVAHAILIVYTEEGTFVLDNQDKRVEAMQDVNRYKPIFSINSNNWWLHRGVAGA